jgi:hypothetical protein
MFGSRGYINGSGQIGADGKTLYVSFLQQPNGTTSFYEFEFHRGDIGDPGRIGGIGNDQAGTNVNLRAPGGIHTPIGAGDTNVNFYVVRIDYKAGNDDIRVYRNPVSSTEPAVPTLTALAQADMSFNGISFGAFLNSRTVAHDEVRLGETWASVVASPSHREPTSRSRAMLMETASPIWWSMPLEPIPRFPPRVPLPSPAAPSPAVAALR